MKTSLLLQPGYAQFSIPMTISRTRSLCLYVSVQRPRAFMTAWWLLCRLPWLTALGAGGKRADPVPWLPLRRFTPRLRSVLVDRSVLTDLRLRPGGKLGRQRQVGVEQELHTSGVSPQLAGDQLWHLTGEAGQAYRPASLNRQQTNMLASGVQDQTPLQPPNHGRVHGYMLDDGAITGRQIMDASSSFSAHSAQTYDGFHVRHWSLLGEDACECTANILRICAA